MRIDVLNGVNLNLLGRRDQATYGDQSIQDLETQVYAWARDLDLQVAAGRRITRASTSASCIRRSGRQTG